MAIGANGAERVMARNEDQAWAEIEDDAGGAGRWGEIWTFVFDVLVILAILVIAVLAGLEIFRLVASAGAPGVDVQAYDDRAIAYRVAAVLVLTLFMPFTAVSFFYSRRRIRKRELIEDSRMMGLNYWYYAGLFSRDKKPIHFLYAVGFASIVTLLGLLAAFLGDELRLHRGENLLLGGALDAEQYPSIQRNSLMFFGIAFLGAYLWGLQQIITRYFRNDLVPGVYYFLGVRMIVAAIIALLFYQMIHAFGLTPEPDPNGSDLSAAGLLPATAFLIGSFPSRALQYMTEKISVFSSASDTKTNAIPLETIQGISVNDKLRLVEEGVDSVSALAHADFIRLLFTTPFSVSELVDWILQAKLCLLIGKDIDELRSRGIRTVWQLRFYGGEGDFKLDALSEETKITRTIIATARRSIEEDKSIGMLVTLYGRINSIENLRKPGDPPVPPSPRRPRARARKPRSDAAARKRQAANRTAPKPASKTAAKPAATRARAANGRAKKPSRLNA